MYIDVTGLCSDEQSVVGAAGNYLSERSVNLLDGATALSTDGMGNTVPHDPGAGENLEVFAAMDSDLDSAGGACTIQAQLISADDEALTVNVVVHAETAAIPEATAVRGYQFKLPSKMPAGIDDVYGGFRFITAGEAATAGTVTAAIGVGLRHKGFMQP